MALKTRSKLSDIISVRSSIFIIIASSVLISGCGATLSPVKRKPLQISSLETSLTSTSRKVLVRFESTLPGHSLANTVWDNGSGAFSDEKESQQIGFTQDYSKLIPAVAIGGGVGASSVANQPEYTRILIPFGRIFEGVFQSGLSKTFPESMSCSDEPCELEKLKAGAYTQSIRLKVLDYKVWENPLNHLNMKAVVECEVYQSGAPNRLEYKYTAHHEVTKHSLGSMMSTSSDFIREMNDVSNKFAGALSEDILENLRKNLGD